MNFDIFPQKAVHMGEEQEYSLYNRVKNAEYARQKREQAVRKTQSKLLERRREHANELKTKMVEMTKEERELEQRLERERAELAKVSEPHPRFVTLPPPLCASHSSNHHFLAIPQVAILSLHPPPPPPLIYSSLSARPHPHPNRLFCCFFLVITFHDS